MNLEPQNSKKQIRVCTQMRYAPNPMSCGHSGSEKLLQAITEAVIQEELDIEVVPTGCFLMCEIGPNVKLLPKKIMFHHADMSTVEKIIDICKNQ